MDYKVLITTSGTGSRLKELTASANKSVLAINNKAIISYIIEAYPAEVPFVITLGYFGDQVRDFLKLTYPERIFEFVVVDKYEGPGSSLGYSMLCAKENLQCPFVFHACDTIVVEPIPAPDRNWAAGYLPDTDKKNFAQYRTHKVVDNKIIKMNDKGVEDFNSVHIGIAGINDYEKFWQILAELYQGNPDNSGWSDVHVISQMIGEGIGFEMIPYKVWLDTGNPAALEATENYLKSKNN
jgi:NDP-sugar pyrophosphorylase family protein